MKGGIQEMDSYQNHIFFIFIFNAWDNTMGQDFKNVDLISIFASEEHIICIIIMSAFVI